MKENDYTGLLIIDHDGWLMVRDIWVTSWDKPEQTRLYWPIGIKARDLPWWVDVPVRVVEISYGIYSRVEGTRIRLKDGGRTKPAHIERREVKRPKWARSWCDGCWSREEPR